MFIAISQRLISTNEYYELRECLALEWGELFNTNKLFKPFLPLPLSYKIPFDSYLQSTNIIAVILSGGNDLSIFSNNELSKMRDNYETLIIKKCIKMNIPLIGICRGAQIIAHFFNSKIESNISKDSKNYINHVGNHLVNSSNNKFIVNSYHNFCITKLGKDLKILASAEDKSIESFKHKNLAIYGIMWHIERSNGLENIDILKEFFNDIQKYMKNFQI